MMTPSSHVKATHPCVCVVDLFANPRFLIAFSELTRRLEREMKERVTGGGGESGGGSSAAGVVTAPPPRDLQAIYQRSREQEVVSGDARDNATLEARLRG